MCRAHVVRGRDHGQLHRGASLRRAILPRRPCPAHRHRSACATSAEQGVPMKLHACTASLLVLAALLTGCQKSGPADPVADAGVAPEPAAAATADSAAIASDAPAGDAARSEEPTSELPSLMP